MSAISQADIKTKLVELLDTLGQESTGIEADTNLVEGGFLDSLSFLNFILKLEGDYGLEIDFSELDPTEFTSIEKLTELVNG